MCVLMHPSLYKATEHVCFGFLCIYLTMFTRSLGNRRHLLLGGASRERVKLLDQEKEMTENEHVMLHKFMGTHGELLKRIRCTVMNISMTMAFINV